jgi:hypothetical protein
LVRVELQLVCQVAIGSAAKLQPQGLCIYYTECTWVHFSIAQLPIPDDVCISSTVMGDGSNQLLMVFSHMTFFTFER